MIAEQTVLTKDPAYYNLRYCFHPGCNRIYEASLTGDLGYCPEHHKYYERQHDEPARGGARARCPQGPTKFWVVLADPTPLEEGGIESGARFDSVSFLFTLYNGYWPDGLTIQHDGRVYRVLGKQIEREDGLRFEASCCGTMREVRK